MGELLSYGPLAFGCVVLFAVWAKIVKPLLKQQRDDLQQQREDRIAESAANRAALSNACDRLEKRMVEGIELQRQILATVQDLPDRIRDHKPAGGMKLAE